MVCPNYRQIDPLSCKDVLIATTLGTHQGPRHTFVYLRTETARFLVTRVHVSLAGHMTYGWSEHGTVPRIVLDGGYLRPARGQTIWTEDKK